MEPIEDHAIIGDGRSAALVARGGAIDWLCWPRFDSPSIFGALLDDRAGSWRIAPATPFRATRRYLPSTNVLETTFETESGEVRVTDVMTIASEGETRRLVLPEHEIVRLVRCTRGEVEVELLYEPRPGWGRREVALRDRGALGVRADLPRAGVLWLRTDVPLAVEGGTARGRARLRAGEERCASLSFAGEWPAVLSPLGDHARETVRRAEAWWRAWVGEMRYEGPARDMVERSALALRLLVFAPSGAIVAAPTTSLPERIGGDLNWDYRYCWLRDASLTVRALVGLGYQAEAEAFASWLLHSTRLTRPRLRILYDVFGNHPGRERELWWLSGYRGSRPVREGNAAIEQYQLDVYGEVIDAVFHAVRGGLELDRETRKLLSGFGEFVCRHWQEPDEGIWEPRSGRRCGTHSKLLCWVALDRLLALHDEDHLEVDEETVRRERDRIAETIRARAWNEELGSYVSALDGDELDASLLLLSWYGLERADSERMKRTHARIRERLGAGDGLIYRYRGDESSGEGAFGICSFWAVEQLALGGGTLDEARRAFDELLRRANDVGLYGEEIDPATGAALGNFPQGFTHVGLINAALTIGACERGEPPFERRAPSLAVEARR